MNPNQSHDTINATFTVLPQSNLPVSLKKLMERCTVRVASPQHGWITLVVEWQQKAQYEAL